MVTGKRIVIVLVLASLAFVGARRFFTTETARIQRRLNALQRVIAKDANESNAQTLLKMERLQGLLDNPVTIDVPAYRLSKTLSPREVAQQAVAIRANVEHLGVAFRDVSIRLRNDHAAEVTMTVRVWSDHYRQHTHAVEVTCELRKIDGAWRFTNFTQQEVLQR